MPALTRLSRIVRLGTLPETRGILASVARSVTIRDFAGRAVNDRARLVRDFRNRPSARDLVRTAARHPATRELANAGLLFLPGRYLPLGWAATWATHRILRRYVDPPADVPDEATYRVSRTPKNVTPPSS